MARDGISRLQARGRVTSQFGFWSPSNPSGDIMSYPSFLKARPKSPIALTSIITSSKFAEFHYGRNRCKSCRDRLSSERTSKPSPMLQRLPGRSSPRSRLRDPQETPMCLMLRVYGECEYIIVYQKTTVNLTRRIPTMSTCRNHP